MTQEVFEIKKVATVRNGLNIRQDGGWGKVISDIILEDKFHEDHLTGIEEFSHIEIVFGFDKLTGEDSKTAKRSPRNNKHLDEVGIFAQRASMRPNLLGVSIAEIICTNGKVIKVKGLDALNGSPVFDIKPVFREFLPQKDSILQPEWVSEIMKNYWSFNE